MMGVEGCRRRGRRHWDENCWRFSHRTSQKERRGRRGGSAAHLILLGILRTDLERCIRRRVYARRNERREGRKKSI